jgi:fluoride exporter
MLNLSLIALGGALGSVLRHLLSELISALVGTSLIWAVLLVNVSGSFLIGLAAGASWDHLRLADAPFMRYFVIIGLCGGYTTFSAFSLQTFSLLQSGEIARAGLNVFLSISFCLVATWAGFALSAALSR